MAAQAEDPAAVREQQQVGVRRRVHDLVDEVLVAQLRALDAAPAAPLGAERVGRDRLHVARLGHGDHDVLVVDEVLDAELARVVHDLRCRRSSAYLSRTAAISRRSPRAASTSSARIDWSSAIVSRSFGHLLVELAAPEAREASERHVQDVVRLLLGEVEGRRHQRRSRAAGRSSEPRIAAITASSMSIALQQALDDVGAGLGLAQAELRAPRDDVDLVRDVVA